MFEVTFNGNTNFGIIYGTVTGEMYLIYKYDDGPLKFSCLLTVLQLLILSNIVNKHCIYGATLWL